MRPARSLEGFLIVACVVLAAIFGVACPFDPDDDLALSVRTADSLALPLSDVSGGLRERGAHALLAGAAAQRPITPLGSVAAVPGGLCLLI